MRLTLDLHRDEEHPKTWVVVCPELGIVSAASSPQDAICAWGRAIKTAVDIAKTRTSSKSGIEILEELAAGTSSGSNPSGYVAWPDSQPKRYNACTDPCDMWTGPCACGAWHKDGI